MYGFDKLSFFYGDVMHWCRYTKDDYGEGLFPPTNVVSVDVILIAGKNALQQKEKPSFQKNLEKLLICGDESNDNEKFLGMKDDEFEEPLPRRLENSKMVMI